MQIQLICSTRADTHSKNTWKELRATQPMRSAACALNVSCVDGEHGDRVALRR